MASSESITKYADYVETNHKTLLSRVSADTTGAKNDNPYTWIINGREISPHPLFSSKSLVNTYSDLDPLFTSWKNNIRDFNITSLWATLFSDTTDNTAVRDLVAAERSLLEDALDQDVMPRVEVGMRDINAVNSSAFVIAKANLEDSKEKELYKFSAELQYRLLNIVIDRYKTHLSWTSGILGTQMDAVQMFLATEFQYSAFWNETKVGQRRWRSEMNEYYRVAVGALQSPGTVSKSSGSSGGGGGYSVPRNTPGYGAGPVTQSQPVGSSMGSAISGAATGAMIGTAIAPGVGTLIGAGLGLLAGGLF